MVKIFIMFICHVKIAVNWFKRWSCWFYLLTITEWETVLRPLRHILFRFPPPAAVGAAAAVRADGVGSFAIDVDGWFVFSFSWSFSTRAKFYRWSNVFIFIIDMHLVKWALAVTWNATSLCMIINIFWSITRFMTINL